MVSSLLPLAMVTLLFCYVFGQPEKCLTPSGRVGVCVHTQDCPSLFMIRYRPTFEGLHLLRKSLCGTYHDQDRVCCPVKSCSTPNGEEGTCIGLKSCPALREMLLSNPTEDEMYFIRISRCNSPMKNSVCCGLEKSEEECPSSPLPPDPTSGCCGKINIEKKVMGGEVTAIDDYPWMALLEYKTGDTTTVLCAGVLISGQYVVTASHCIEGDVINEGELVNVILGEYDTSNHGQDCVRVDGGGKDCTDGVEKVPIEKTISLFDDTFHIALIKLQRIVRFTDFIKPICLPTVDFTTTTTDDTILYAAGWGITENNTLSNIKLHVDLPYVSNEKCRLSYEIAREEQQVWDRYICAGGEAGKDTCPNDSGGPLMRDLSSEMELVGIVNYGSDNCGEEGIPAVYAKVFYYIPWIKSMIAAEIAA